MKVSDFNDDLDYSMAASDESFWDAVYLRAFPDMAVSIPNPVLSQSQMLGIDRVIHLKSGRTLYVDEKKRRGTWDDILLEYRSNDNTGAQGWMNKQLLIDYLAYAFMDTKVIYVMDWLSLRRVWIENGLKWSTQFKTITAKNKGYNTLSLAVPIQTLMESINNSIKIQL